MSVDKRHRSSPSLNLHELLRSLAGGSLLLITAALSAADAKPDPLWGGGTPAPQPGAGQPGFGSTPSTTGERVPGHLHGSIEHFELVKKIWAVDRSLTQAFIQNTVKTQEFEGKLDPEHKTYSFDRLPQGPYDLKLELNDGRIIEGCDLAPAASSLDPLTYDDRKKIRTVFDNIRHFEDQVALWKIEGNGEHATAIVELLRTEKTSLNEKVNGDDFVIWRIELWQFTKHGEAWEHDGSQVLIRIRPSKNDFETWNIEFRQELGGVKVAPQAYTTCNIVVPEVSDIHCGRYSHDYLHAHRQAGPVLYAGIETKVLLIDPETGTIVLDAGAGKAVTKNMEAWIYAADGKTVIAKAPVLRISDTQTTVQVPGLKAHAPEVDPDDPYDKQGEAKVPEALKDLKVGVTVRLVPFAE